MVIFEKKLNPFICVFKLNTNLNSRVRFPQHSRCKMETVKLLIDSTSTVKVGKKCTFTQDLFSACFIEGSLKVPRTDSGSALRAAFSLKQLQFTACFTVHLCGTISSPQHTAVLFLCPEPLKTSANVTALCPHSHQFVHTVMMSWAVECFPEIK